MTFHGLCRAGEVKRALRMLAGGVMGVREMRLELAMTPLFHAS